MKKRKTKRNHFTAREKRRFEAFNRKWRFVNGKLTDTTAKKGR